MLWLVLPTKSGGSSGGCIGGVIAMNTPVTCFTALISIAEEEQVFQLSVFFELSETSGLFFIKL